MFERFFPKRIMRSSYSVNYRKYYNKGYRGVLFDIDNTLVKHGAPPNEKAKRLFRKLRNIGFKTCLISNNNEARVKPFAQAVESPYICNAHKPSTKSYLDAVEIMGTSVDETLFIGDQVFTDVYGANRANMYTILVRPIHPKEEIQIVFKRKLERIVLYSYNLRNKRRRRKGKAELVPKKQRQNQEQNNTTDINNMNDTVM